MATLARQHNAAKSANAQLIEVNANNEGKTILETIEENKLSRETEIEIINRDEQVFELPKQLFELTHLKNLTISGFGLKTLPKEILEFRQLEKLTIAASELAQFPIELKQLHNLRELSIESFSLTKIESGLDDWQTIQYLNIGGCLKVNQLNSLPPNLTYLHIGDTSLGEIPSIVFSLKNLLKIVATNLGLTSLPDELFSMHALRVLYVGDNELTELPSKISKLSNLEDIWINKNKLSKLPNIFDFLPKLHSFYAEDNYLSYLPDTFSSLKNLSSLNLNGNQFSQFPEHILKLYNLVYLYLYNQKGKSNIYFIPREIINLPKLKHFAVNSENITNMPQEIVAGGLPAIRSYFAQLDEQEKDYIFEAKVLILGEPGAGKTSLAWKLIDSNRELPEEEDTTRGVDIEKYHFSVSDNNLPDSIKGQKRDFCLNIWDFGGQEIYKATHRFFLSNRALYILVSDTRKEDTDFNYWLHIIEIFGGQSPLLIISNEKAGRTRPLDSIVLKGRFGNIQQILDVNLADKDTYRLDIIKSYIEFYATKLAHVGNAVPAKWKEIREVIEASSDDTISVQDYFAICKGHGIEKQADALVLSQYFHDIGVFLHFQKDAILKKTLFLKPTWATDAVYKVLDHKILNQKNGRFSRVDADIIWHEDEFASVRDELLRLMQNFFLTYEISETEGYIVPERLSYEQPAYDWNDAGNLILQYEYKPFMPKGLLTQFIVKMNRHIADHAMVWRKGVVLSWQDTLAEITETYDVGTIKVRVAGRNKRDFMTLITSEFDNINDQYRKLNIRQLIPCNCPDCKVLETPHFYDLKILERRIDKNQPTIQCETDYRAVNVKGLLYDVFNSDLLSNTKSMELAAMQEIEDANSSSVTAKKKIFISYAHTDEKYLTRLLTHFTVLEREGIELDVWSDKRLKSGVKWRKEIEKAMQECQVAILLVSTDFLASKFITQTELPAILRGAEERGVVILPLVLTSCRYTQNKDLKEFQAQNDPSKPLVKLNPNQRDEEYLRLLDRVTEELLPAE